MRFLQNLFLSVLGFKYTTSISKKYYCAQASSGAHTLTISLSFRLAAVCKGVCPKQFAMLASAPCCKRIVKHSARLYLAAI